MQRRPTTTSATGLACRASPTSRRSRVCASSPGRWLPGFATRWEGAKSAPEVWATRASAFTSPPPLCFTSVRTLRRAYQETGARRLNFAEYPFHTLGCIDLRPMCRRPPGGIMDGVDPPKETQVDKEEQAAVSSEAEQNKALVRRFYEA